MQPVTELENKPYPFDRLGGVKNQVYMFNGSVLGIAQEDNPRFCDLKEVEVPDPEKVPGDGRRPMKKRKVSNTVTIRNSEIKKKKVTLYETLDTILECGTSSFLETPFEQGTKRDEIPMIGRDKFETLMKSYYHFCKRDQTARLTYELENILSDPLSDEDLNSLEECLRLTWERMMKEKMKRLT